MTNKIPYERYTELDEEIHARIKIAEDEMDSQREMSLAVAAHLLEVIAESFESGNVSRDRMISDHIFEFKVRRSHLRDIINEALFTPEEMTEVLFQVLKYGWNEPGREGA